MGNTGSCEGSYAGIGLKAEGTPIVAIDQRFVSSKLTRLRLKEISSYSKSLTFKNVYSKKVLFQTGNDWQFERLLDVDRKSIISVTTTESIKSIYCMHHLGVAVVATEDDGIYVEQRLTTKTRYLDTTLHANFTDITTGERCKIEIQGEWRARSAVLWLKCGPNGSRMAVGKLYRPLKAQCNGFSLDIAPNVDTALVLLICVVVNDLKRLRRSENGMSFYA